MQDDAGTARIRSLRQRIARPRRLLGRADPARGARRGGLPRRAVPRPPARRRRRPGPAQPDAAGHRRAASTSAYLAAGADIATTNTFTATSIGQADYGLEDVVYEMNVAGARLAREVARGEPARLRRRLGRPAQRHALALARASTIPLPHRDLRPGRGGVRRADPRRSPRAASTCCCRDGLRHAEREGRDRRGARGRAPELPLWLSVTIVDRSGRTLSGQTIEAFWTSVEHAEPLIVGVNCSLGAARDAALRRRPRARSRRACVSVLPERRACRTRSAATTSTPEDDEPLPAASSRETGS